MEKDILEHLRNPYHMDLFQPGEWTNATKFLYTAFFAAASDGADTLRILINGFEWYNGDQLIQTFLGGAAPEPRPTYYETLIIILKADVLVQEYCKEIKIYPDYVEVHLAKISEI